MNVMADINNGGEGTFLESGIQVNSSMPAPLNPSSAVTGTTSNMINSAAIANVAGQERFNPLYVNVLAELINQVRTKGRRYNFPFEDYQTLADVHHSWTPEIVHILNIPSDLERVLMRIIRRMTQCLESIPHSSSILCHFFQRVIHHSAIRNPFNNYDACNACSA